MKNYILFHNVSLLLYCCQTRPEVSVPSLNTMLSVCLLLFFFSKVIVQIPGAKKLKVELPVVIGTTPYSGFGSRSLSVISGFSTGWLPFTLPDTPEGKTGGMK